MVGQVFKYCETNTDQGNVGEAAAIAYYTWTGCTVSKPLSQNQRYDLVVEWFRSGKLEKVSVKTTTHKTEYGVYRVLLSTQGGNQSFQTKKMFDPTQVDRLFVLTGAGSMYDIPVGMLNCHTILNLGDKYKKFKVTLGIGEPNSL